MQNQAFNDLLRRWLKGETRASEDSRLERAAQEDPFLADAWEGFSQNTKADHAAKIKGLNDRIGARVAEKTDRKPPMMILLPRLAAAAAILLLLTFSWKWLFSPPEQQDLAIQVPKVETQTEKRAEEAVPSEPEVTQLEKDQAERKGGLKPTVPKTKSVPAPATSYHEDTTKAEGADDIGLADAEVAEFNTAKPINHPPAPGTSGNQGASIAALDKEDAKANLSNANTRSLNAVQPIPTVGGIVVDERGQRATGIPLKRDANTFAITNQDGAFELPSVAPAQVQVVDPAFETQSLRLDDNDEKVVLQRKTKAQKKSFDASDRRDGVGYPSPIGGFGKFEQYIKDNIETPYEAKRAFVSGDVTLEFTFEKDGTPTRVSILRSLGFGCDQVAQHLIENGPKWRNVKPGTWVIYKVAFK